MSSVDADIAADDEMFSEAFGVSVTYVRGEGETELTAEVDLYDQRRSGPDGAETTSQVRGYTITATDLAFTPRVGDQIKETIGGVVKLFEVLPIDDGRCFKWVDAGERKMLVHTKYVGTE